jgi:hypothetical protein
MTAKEVNPLFRLHCTDYILGFFCLVYAEDRCHMMQGLAPMTRFGNLVPKRLSFL